MTEREILDLYDVALESQYLSDLGRDACPLCGYAIRPDDPVVFTDDGEVCERHLEDVPEHCITTEGSCVLLGRQLVGHIDFVGADWYATPARRDWRPSAPPVGPYQSRSAAARAALHHVYPKES